MDFFSTLGGGPVPMVTLGPCTPFSQSETLYENASCAMAFLLAGSLRAPRTDEAALLTYFHSKQHNQNMSDYEFQPNIDIQHNKITAQCIIVVHNSNNNIALSSTSRNMDAKHAYQIDRRRLVLVERVQPRKHRRRRDSVVVRNLVCQSCYA